MDIVRRLDDVLVRRTADHDGHPRMPVDPTEGSCVREGVANSGHIAQPKDGPICRRDERDVGDLLACQPLVFSAQKNFLSVRSKSPAGNLNVLTADNLGYLLEG